MPTVWMVNVCVNKVTMEMDTINVNVSLISKKNLSNFEHGVVVPEKNHSQTKLFFLLFQNCYQYTIFCKSLQLLTVTKFIEWYNKLFEVRGTS